jgi:HEAT repeats
VYAQNKRKLAELALILAPGLEGIVPKIISLDDPDLAAAAIRSLRTHDSPEVRQVVEKMLYDKSVTVQNAALAYLHGVCAPGELQALLERYTKIPTYYYNVVTWLDRILYSPPMIREMYVGELKVLGSDVSGGGIGTFDLG